uniref:Fibronectin type-III domain-containing protein n=1 Tax=Esox lucius TaxID=8010 RepID=A0A3P9A9U9_ESOLU
MHHLCSGCVIMHRLCSGCVIMHRLCSGCVIMHRLCSGCVIMHCLCSGCVIMHWLTHLRLSCREFELRFLNGTWEDVVGCKQINQTTCDLTVELGSDSDYNIRVRAECGSHVSTWAELGRPFNRKETNLTVPAMIVTTMGDALQVMFKDLPLTVAMKVTIWKKGEELKVRLHMFYSMNSNTGMVSVLTGPGTTWLKPTAVTVAVVIMVGLVLVLSWSLTTCSPESCHGCLSKEQLPTALVSIGPALTERDAPMLTIWLTEDNNSPLIIIMVYLIFHVKGCMSYFIRLISLFQAITNENTNLQIILSDY